VRSTWNTRGLPTLEGFASRENGNESMCLERPDHRGNIYPRVAMNEAKITAGRWEVVKTVKRCLDP
jgi:hypothetical protein